MRSVKVITDSTAGLPKRLAEESGIEIVPARIILGSKSYPDDGSLTIKELFEFADWANALAKTAPPGEHQFQETFLKWLEEDYDIFFASISSKMAETVKIASSAASKLVSGRISIFDSLNVSCGAGLLVLEAADLAKRGAGLAEITEHTLKLRDKVRLSFVVDTLKYLYIGGRCSKLTSIVAETLNIKPIINVINGEMVPGDKLRGKHYIDQFIEQAIKDPERIDPKRIFVANCLFNEAGEIKNRLANEFGLKNVIAAELSAAVSVHGGPGALGIAFMYK